MKDMWKEFKEFAFKGNIFDLAIAVVIGGAFGEIVTSLVENLITPLIGVLLGGVDFSGLTWQIGDASVGYGAFIQSIIDFLIIAFSIFMAVKLAMKLRIKQEEEVVEEEPEVDTKEELLVEIRDLLSKQNQAK